MIEVINRQPLEKKKHKEIDIKYHADIPKLENIGGTKSDWIDLYSAEDIYLERGDFKLISLGVSMRLPDGYEAHVLPRSSTFKNFGIVMTNSEGIIDNSYSGTNDIWRFPALAIKNTCIHKGDRICQFRITKKQPHILFNECDELDSVDRGGIGSTGIH